MISNKLTICFDVDLSDPAKAMNYETNKSRDALIAAYTEQVKLAIGGTLSANWSLMGSGLGGHEYIVPARQASDTDDSRKILDEVLKEIGNSKAFSVPHGGTHINEATINKWMLQSAQPATGHEENNYTIKVNVGEDGAIRLAGMGFTVEGGQRAVVLRVSKFLLGETLDKNQSGSGDMSATISAYDARLIGTQASIQGISAAIIDNAQKVEAEMKAFKESLAETIKGEVRANILEMMKPGGLLWRLAK